MRSKLLIGVLSGGLIILAVNAYGTSPVRSWKTDMYNQESIKSFSEGSQLTFPVGSVTTEGLVITSDGYKDVKSIGLPWNDYAKNGFRYNPSLTPKNPIPASQQSIENGEYLYAVYCSSCHGVDANGGTFIAQQRAVPVIRNLIPTFSEGYLFERITYGGPIVTSMPPLGYSLSAEERWDVVNYIKSTFK